MSGQVTDARFTVAGGGPFTGGGGWATLTRNYNAGVLSVDTK